MPHAKSAKFDLIADQPDKRPPGENAIAIKHIVIEFEDGYMMVFVPHTWKDQKEELHYVFLYHGDEQIAQYNGALGTSDDNPLGHSLVQLDEDHESMTPEDVAEFWHEAIRYLLAAATNQRSNSNYKEMIKIVSLESDGRKRLIRGIWSQNDYPKEHARRGHPRFHAAP